MPEALSAPPDRRFPDRAPEIPWRSHRGRPSSCRPSPSHWHRSAHPRRRSAGPATRPGCGACRSAGPRSACPMSTTMSITANRSGDAFDIDPTDGTGDFVDLGTMRARTAGRFSCSPDLYKHGRRHHGARRRRGQHRRRRRDPGRQVVRQRQRHRHAVGQRGPRRLSAGAVTTGTAGVAGGNAAYPFGTLNDNACRIGAHADLRILGTNDRTRANGGR